jgi:hypothetical protein
MKKETWLSGTQISAADQSQPEGVTKDQGSRSSKSKQRKEPPTLATAGLKIQFTENQTNLALNS